MKLSRGGALPETAVTLGIVLTLLFGTFELGLIGLAQLAGDGAAFVAAHASVLGNDPNAAIAGPFPLVAQNATVNIQRTAPNDTSMPVDFQLSDQTNRHGGVQTVRPAQTQATISNGGVGIGNILPKADLSSAAIEANMMVSGFGFDLAGAPMNSSQTYSGQKSYFADDGNAPPYFIGFKFLYHCLPNAVTPAHNGCSGTTSNDIWSGGFAEMLDGSNWSNAQNGIVSGGVYEAMAKHQRIYATIANDLNQMTSVASGNAAGTVLDPAQPCMATVNGWDTKVTVGVPLGSTDTSHDPLNPMAEVPGCS